MAAPTSGGTRPRRCTEHPSRSPSGPLLTSAGAARNVIPAGKALGAAAGGLDGITRFHIATIASQRAKQLQCGARPRVTDAAGHKATRVAVLEVLANAVSWELI
jgi:DNA-directed RNA polymerase subunit K/omega